jgi:hypothetical protein
MKHRTRLAASTALLALALAATAARADWDPGQDHKMHFPQLPDPAGFDVNFKFPEQVADDWRCSETGPVNDLHFWFSARNDWLDLGQLLDTQIYSIRVRIHADVPAGTGGVPYSRPGAVLWQRDYTVGEVAIRHYGSGQQSWYSPASGQVVPNDHQDIYQCNIEQITEPFYQKKGSIYWLHVSIDAASELGWKTSDPSQYPAPYTNNHYQDDATWRPGPMTAWQELIYPAGPLQGQSMDMAFVITGEPPVFGPKMHFAQLPDPTGADVDFTFPRVAADDWRCTETGPVGEVIFWFSSLGDWLDYNVPWTQQIFNIHLSIHEDIPEGPGVPYSRPGALLWEGDFSGDNVVATFFTPGQAWLDPAQGVYAPDNHQKMFMCIIDSIADPFIQEEGRIYWLDISMTGEQALGWKAADVDQYPAPYTGSHFQDDAVWAPDINVPAIPWLELIWPANAPKAGQSIDLAFVIREGIPTGVGDGAPRSYRLEQNSPNPFNPTTTIRYSLPERSNVELAVFGVDGGLVRVLESGSKPEGTFEATWDGRDASGRPVASGVYFYRLKAGSFAETRKMVLIK